MIASTPLVSICIPAYKNPVLLERCIKSALEQTYSNFEIIVTDDSPDDQVEQVLKKFDFDSRVKYLKNAAALGSPENWNEGLRQAVGDYIKVMHHDDWFAVPDALEKFVSIAIKTNADFVCAYCYNVRADRKEEKRIIGRFKTKWQREPKLILFANYIGNPSTVMFKNLKDRPVLYDKNSIWYVDVLFYYEFIVSHPQVAYIDEFLIDTSAGLDTQVTNSVVDKSIGIREYDYVARKHGLYDEYNFLARLSLFEILGRYNIKSKDEFEEILGRHFEYELPYFLLKWPIHHQVYNVFKHFLMLI